MKRHPSSPFFAHAFPRRKRGGIVAVLLILIIGAAVICGSYYASTLKGSRERVDETFAQKIDGEKAMQRKQESENLEARFNSVHEIKREKITSADIDVYEQAVTAYEQYLAFSGIDTRTNLRLDKMRRKLHSLRADKIRENTLKLEKEAEKLADANKHAEAEKLFRQAAEQERRIETQYALADKRNHARTVQLQNRMLAMQSIPLLAKAEKLEKEGTAALEKNDWKNANRLLREALKIRNLLWNDYRLIVPADSKRIAKLNQLIETVDSSADYEDVERLRQEALHAESIHDWKLALSAWDKAYRLQRLLEKNFPRSKFATEKRRLELEESLANTGARADFITFQENMETIRKAIREHKTDNVPFLAHRNTIIAARILEKYPRSTLITQDLQKDLAYINVKSRNIPQIQKALFDLLIPIPGYDAEKIKMMKTEVSQALYTFVAGNNPSADTTQNNAPVESVSYEDVQSFCKNLSLIIGYDVRPPSLEEFLAAAGTFDATKISDQAWTLGNSEAKIHRCASKAANDAGFYDLYGNVSEWIFEPVRKDDISGTAVGGDCQFPEALLQKEHIQKTMLKEKSRLRGFRVIVDFSKPI